MGLAEDRRALVGAGFAVLGVLCFSLRPILIKLSYGFMQDPVTLLALRMLFSAPFFALAAVWSSRRGHSQPLGRSDLLLVCALGLLSYYAASLLDFLALQHISAGLGRLVLFLYPTIVVLLSAVFVGRRIQSGEARALALCYAGLLIVLAPDLGPGRGELLLGSALAFGSAACYATYLVTGAQVIARVGSLRFSALAMLAASAACILQFLVLRPLAALDLPWPVYGYALAMAVVSTVIPVFLTSEALRRIGANPVAILGALGPVSTILLGWLGLEESLTPLQLGGVGLVVLGVLGVSLRPQAKTGA